MLTGLQGRIEKIVPRCPRRTTHKAEEHYRDQPMNTETSITPEEVHLWLAFPDEIRDPDLLAAYRDLMPAGERTRQQRFHFERHGHQYLIARALVRTTLSRYTGVAPEQWRFCINRYGRPEIESPAGLAPLRFNLSHTAGLVALAVVLKSDIGVDVEDTHRKRIGIELADRYFSETEARALHALPPSLQRARFFEYWTLKEAYIKAKGMGLSIPLEQFSFHMEDERPLRISFDPSLHDRPDVWHFWLMQPTEHHKAALALRQLREPPRISFRKVAPLAEEHPIEVVLLHTSRESRSSL